MQVRPGKPVYPPSMPRSPGFLSGSGYVNIPFNGSGASPLCLSLPSVRLSCVSLMGEEGSVCRDFVRLGSRGVLGLGDGLLLFFFKCITWFCLGVVLGLFFVPATFNKV